MMRRLWMLVLLCGCSALYPFDEFTFGRRADVGAVEVLDQADADLVDAVADLGAVDLAVVDHELPDVAVVDRELLEAAAEGGAADLELVDLAAVDLSAVDAGGVDVAPEAMADVTAADLAPDVSFDIGPWTGPIHCRGFSCNAGCPVITTCFHPMYCVGVSTWDHDGGCCARNPSGENDGSCSN